MLFNSIGFLVFFPLTTFLYFSTPTKWRWLPMLAASAYFYMAFMPYYILILAFTILVDYVAGLAIASTQGKARTLWLVVSLTANLAVLATFKYYNFAITSLTAILGHPPLPLLEWVLPLGLSFHTFQSMAYTIEIYRGNQPAERHLGYLALYVLFYPQLVAGPIERPQNLIHQFREPHHFDYTNATDGLKLMAWGFFKKCVIADRLAPLVDLVYNEPGLYRGLPLIVATVAFSFQIYCDFSGYSDIARGAARVLGIRLMNNFANPYLATSIVDFWRRWHISLSTWFRDYLYLPLGGNRVSFLRKNLNVFIVFLLSGLWHGANWTFVIWGALHGLFFMVTRMFQSAQPAPAADRGPRKPGLPVRILQVAATFAVVSFAWIFFRARNVHDALYIVTHLAGPMNRSDPFLAPAGHALLGIRLDLWIAAGLIGLLLIVERIQGLRELPEVLRPCRAWLRWSVYYALILVIFALGVFAESPFIYFQF